MKYDDLIARLETLACMDRSTDTHITEQAKEAMLQAAAALRELTAQGGRDTTLTATVDLGPADNTRRVFVGGRFYDIPTRSDLETAPPDPASAASTLLAWDGLRELIANGIADGFVKQVADLSDSVIDALQRFAEEGKVMDAKLLPCPFCGGEAEIWQAHQERTAWIGCMGRCSVLVSKEYKTNEEAIAAWNTRVPTSDATLLAAEMRDRAVKVAKAQETKANERSSDAGAEDRNDWDSGILFGTEIGARFIAANIAALPLPSDPLAAALALLLDARNPDGMFVFPEHVRAIFRAALSDSHKHSKVIE